MIRHLPYFVVAAEEQNLTKAAARLGISASALTRRIQGLEYELGGVLLFERHQSGISLTAAGRKFRDDIAAPLDLIALASRRAKRLNTMNANALRVGYNPIALRQGCVREALGSFQENYPDIRLELVPMMSRFQADALRVGDLDAGILSVPFFDVGFCSEMIDDFPMLLTLNKNHCKAAKADLSLADFEGENFVGISRTWIPGVYDAIAAQFERAGVEHRIICETHCDTTIANLIGLGVGVGFVTPTAEGAPSEGLLQRVLDDFAASLPLSLVWRSGDPRIGKLVTEIGDAVAADTLP